MAATKNFEWNQGEDFPISLVYKSGPVGAAAPVDLNLYTFRMDIVAPDGKVLSVLNDDAIADTDPNEAGSQPDNTYEVTMNSDGEIKIELGRALTLPGGAFYKYITANPPVNTFSYDMFLRDNNGKQKKIMGGTISIERSVTHWA